MVLLASLLLLGLADEAGDYWPLGLLLWLAISTVIYVGPRWQ
jgi:hypothetical protein